MFVDGLRHRFAFSGVLGIIAPHHPLQGGHFHHHMADQVRFAEFGCAQGGLLFIGG